MYLGFDLSTQSLKCAIYDTDRGFLPSVSVTFETDLPEFHTTHGYHSNPPYVTTPTLLFVRALDLLIERLAATGIDFSSVVALSGTKCAVTSIGCGQQHGSVYWKRNTRLDLLDSDATLGAQLSMAFSIPNSPIWMDESTQKECREFQDACPDIYSKTGSRAYERYEFLFS